MSPAPQQSTSMLPPPPATPNKRYWGEEKNIDSIYSIYLKKISYTYNNDISSQLPAKQTNGHNSNTTPRRGHAIDEFSASSNDLARLSSQQVGGSPLNSFNRRLNSCQDKVDGSSCVHPQDEKPKESPRGRKLFFQKYRRRSCSMDKYSFDKQSNLKSSTPNSKPEKTSKTMRFSSSAKKLQQQQLASSQLSEDFSHSHDKLDTLSIDNKNGSIDTSASDSQSARRLMNNSELQKSMHELYSQSQSQSLQWETRQIRVLQAATLDHVLKFILLINSQKDKQTNNLNSVSSVGSSCATSASDQDSSDHTGDSQLEEERNNVAHIIHVLFCTYRTYTNPYEMMMKLMDYSDICRVEQYRFVMHYWMDNYPEDFDYIIPDTQNTMTTLATNGTSNGSQKDGNTNAHSNSFSHSITSCDSSLTTRTAATSDSETSSGHNLGVSGSQSGGSDSLARRLSNLSIKTNEEKLGVPLISELLRLCRDEYIRSRAIRLRDSKIMDSPSRGSLDSDSAKKSRSSHHHNGSKNSAVLDLDSRYVAQQLTAIDLENFLSLKPYSLLEGTKSDKRIQSMIKNFNLLSRHVVVTILKSHQPSTVASHWIAIAMNLRKIKNFNSLKAIIAGLTNESIYRLKQVIWNKLDKMSLANFKTMASIVDDVNNQIVLRQTQLVVEGTAKMSIEDDSFGTIPYLGTFLTDLNMIDARYPNYVPSPKDSTSKLKLINLEKCAKQFEILTQVQLLQKNVLASLHAIQRRNHFDEQTTLNKLKMEYNQNHQMLLAKPAIPKVARLFENWFYDSNVASMTDKQCYEISVALEQNVVTR